MRIRNTNPLGDVTVTLLDREVAAGEVVEVTDEQAAELLAQAGNWEPVEPDSNDDTPQEG